MLTLYDYLPSQNAYKVRLLLHHLGLPYRTVIVSIFEGEGERAEYLAINPSGAVPALRLDDNRTLAESNAILTFLAENTIYLPEDPYQRAKVFQWLCFEGDYVQSTLATLRHWKMTGKDKNYPASVVEAKQAGAVKTLSILNRALNHNAYLSGDTYTIADISVFAYVHRAEEADIPLSGYPNIERWVADIRSQPDFLGEVHPYSIDPYSTRELP
ncbi:MAG: glutathione S-transferase family protein [Pseudomonadota bacterium]